MLTSFTLIGCREVAMELCRFVTLISILMLLSTNTMSAEKSFVGITCKTDIPSALIGRYMPNERVAATEARHKEIGLKDIGAYGIESEGDPWTLISWQICGREYLLLEHRDVVMDVLASPLLQGGPQSQVVSCSVDGSRLTGTAVAFASNREQLSKPVEHAWLINDKTYKFSKVYGKEIVCTP